MAIKLKGEPVPELFIDDGASYVPDFWIRRAARVHDWQYHLLRAKYRVMEHLKDINQWELAARLESEIRHERKQADKNFRINIHLLSEGSKLKYLAGLWMQWRYYIGVRHWGWMAVKGSGHDANFTMLSDEIEKQKQIWS